MIAMLSGRNLWAAVAGAAGLALAGLAWTQIRPAPAEPPPGGATPGAATLQPGRADAAALAVARRSPLAERSRTALRGGREPQLLERIQASPVPVLAPPEPALLQTARFYPADRTYTLVVRRPGQVIEIVGTTRVFTPPPGAVLPVPAPAAAGGAARIAAASPAAGAAREAAARGLTAVTPSATEYGVDVSFLRFGVLYNVTFYCDDRDALSCSQAEAIRFAARLEVIGGGGG